MWTDDEILEFIIASNAIEGIDETDPESDYVCQHIDALKHAALTINPKNAHSKIIWIKYIHEALMENLCKPYGQWRQVGVHIGGHSGAYHTDIPHLMESWCKKNPTTEETIWLHHLDFEIIHPFVDGNGRTGRILWAAERYHTGHTDMKLIKPEDRWDYYEEINRRRKENCNG